MTSLLAAASQGATLGLAWAMGHANWIT